MNDALEPLSALDATFLHVETTAMPMHVGGLYLFAPSAGDAGLTFFNALKHQMAARMHLAPAFTRTLVGMPLAIANPMWMSPGPVDLDHHVTLTRLPAPGSAAQLEASVAGLHGNNLDRRRPLWSLTVITGLASGEVALYAKVHHAALDGVAAAALTAVLLDRTATPCSRAAVELQDRETAPGTRPEVPPQEARSVVNTPAEAARQPGYAPTPPGALARLATGAEHGRMQLQQVVSMLPGLLALGARTAYDAWSSAARAAQQTQTPAPFAPGGDATRPSSNAATPLHLSTPTGPSAALGELFAPRTPLNVSIGSTRCFATAHVSLSAVKATAATLSVSVNDLYMAMCSGALRAWLQDRHALPRRPLVAAVPHSVRARGDMGHNNQALMMLAELATDAPDPRDRLLRIHAAMTRGKALASRVKAVLPADVPSLGLPWLMRGLAVTAENLRWAELMPPLANVFISQVMVGAGPFHVAGARMTHGYPASIVTHGMALNITAQGIGDHLDIGLVACERAVHDLTTLAAKLPQAFAEYQALAHAMLDGMDVAPTA